MAHYMLLDYIMYGYTIHIWNVHCVAVTYRREVQ